MIDQAALRERIDVLPRVRVALLPTALESISGFAEVVGLQSMFLKRDDLTGLLFGGNKVRELDFLIGDALASQCDVLIAGGGVAQSNHARQCAAAAIRSGLRPRLVLRSGGRGAPSSGNALLLELMGIQVDWVDTDPNVTDRMALSSEMERVATEERGRGARPYVLHSSSHPLAAVAYVECVLELAAQMPPGPATILVTSMGATHAGLALGVALLGLPWRVVAVTWKPVGPDQREIIVKLIEQTASLLGVPSVLAEGDLTIVDCGPPAYGYVSPVIAETWSLALRSSAVLLDPVYTARGMAGLLAEVAGGRVDPAVPIVFVHTGGLPAVFAYGEELLPPAHLSSTG